jgi:hypothetical protein
MPGATACLSALGDVLAAAALRWHASRLMLPSPASMMAVIRAWTGNLRRPIMLKAVEAVAQNFFQTAHFPVLVQVVAALVVVHTAAGLPWLCSRAAHIAVQFACLSYCLLRFLPPMPTPHPSNSLPTALLSLCLLASQPQHVAAEPLPMPASRPDLAIITCCNTLALHPPVQVQVQAALWASVSHTQAGRPLPPPFT